MAGGLGNSTEPEHSPDLQTGLQSQAGILNRWKIKYGSRQCESILCWNRFKALKALAPAVSCLPAQTHVDLFAFD